MNILAHLYLSNEIDLVMLGNYMGDFVKGKQYLNYPAEVQKGILLHRQIDVFTDNHPLHKKSRDHFRSAYGLYTGIVTDIVYDHYLAINWYRYHSSPLTDYAENVYRFINQHGEILPDQLKNLTPYMINNNWLVLYSQISGIERVLNGMSRNTSLPDKTKFAVNIIENMYYELQEEFTQFFEEIRKSVSF